MLDPAMKFSGHSNARSRRPNTRFMIWSIGIGLTAGSSVFVRKSQKILGQKNPSIAAAIWSGVPQLASVSIEFHPQGYLQVAAARMMSLAQWFLISFPMASVPHDTVELCVSPIRPFGGQNRQRIPLSCRVYKHAYAFATPLHDETEFPSDQNESARRCRWDGARADQKANNNTMSSRRKGVQGSGPAG